MVGIIKNFGVECLAVGKDYGITLAECMVWYGVKGSMLDLSIAIYQNDVQLANNFIYEELIK
nr:3086_t:CDS:2 [Entrophospora candida]